MWIVDGDVERSIFIASSSKKFRVKAMTLNNIEVCTTQHAHAHPMNDKARESEQIESRIDSLVDMTSRYSSAYDARAQGDA